MKVCLIGPSVEQKGGVASVLRGLRGYLATHEIGCVSIATTSGGSWLEQTRVFVAAWLRLAWICVSRRCDVVHIHMASRGSCLRKSLLATTCQLLRTPYIVHLHGAEFHVFFGSELGAIGQAFVRRVCSRARFVAVLSGEMSAWVRSALAVSNTVVVYNGTGTVMPPQAPTRAAPTILFLGRIGERKGVRELLMAMKQISAAWPDAVLELGGDGEIAPWLSLCEDQPAVRFLGWLDEAGRAAALARAAIFCLPSWHEGMPMSILEAMSVGLPVVSTRVGGIPEVVVHDETGLLIDAGDVEGLARALCSLLSDPQRAGAMGARALERQTRLFSLESMGRKCVELYTQCV